MLQSPSKSGVMKKRHLIPGLTVKAKIWATLLPVIGIVLAVLITLIGVKTDWQMLADEMKAEGYTPSAEIEAVADSLQLTRKGKAVFYATRPELQKSAVFNHNCGSDGDGSYTLGCYWNDGEDEHIALFDTGVSELRESDIYYDFIAERNNSALHEMLHAVYDRLDEEGKHLACANALTIANEIPSLKTSLGLYPDSQYCSEAYARIGSEYISSLENYDISSKAKVAAKILSGHFNQYFSYNYNLAAAHRSNQATETSLRLYLTQLHIGLATERNYVETLRSSYYYNPTFAAYANTNNAIAAYNNRLATYKSYYAIYTKIHTILDSESGINLASL